MIASSRRTRSRSTWIVSPRTGSRWASLSTTGVGFAAVDAQVEHGAGAGEREAQLARVGVEAQRLVAAAVDDAEHAALAAQAARRARAGGGPAVDAQFGGRRGHEANGDSSNRPIIDSGGARIALAVGFVGDRRADREQRGRGCPVRKLPVRRTCTHCTTGSLPITVQATRVGRSRPTSE